MASPYFDEHNCTDSSSTSITDNNPELQLARLLVEGGWTTTFGVHWDQLFPGTIRRPTAKQTIDNLERITVSTANCADQCPICIAQFNLNDTLLRLPCGHRYHDVCLLGWLRQTNTCPVCRFELPTDDATYEAYRREQKRKMVRDAELEQLHDTMYQ